MIRPTGAALLACVAFLSSEASGLTSDVPAPVSSALRYEDALLGRPVLLADGARIGQVASAWKDGPNAVVLTVRLDAETRLGRDAMTLTVPGPLDTRLPIRLLVDYAAFQGLVAPVLP